MVYSFELNSCIVNGTGSSGTGFNGGLGTSYQDAAEIAAPANPAAGDDRLWLDSTTHQLSCHTSSGGSCMPTGGSVTLPFISVKDSPYSAKGDGVVAWDGYWYNTIPTPTTGTSATASAPGVTTGFANDVVISVFYNWNNATFTWGALSAGTARVNVGSTSAINGMLVGDQTVVAAGAVPAVTAGISGSSNWWGASFMVVPTSGQTVTFVAASNATVASGANITINQPTGAAAGDVELGCLEWYSGASDTNTISANPSQFPQSNYSVPTTTSFAGGHHPIWCWSRQVQSTDPSSYTWTQSITTGGMSGFIVDYTNVGGTDNPLFKAGWSATTSYPFGAQIMDSNENLEQVITPGTSGGIVPTWPVTKGNTVTDGSITWMTAGAAPVFAAGDAGKLLCIGGLPASTISGTTVEEGCGYVGNEVSSSEILPIGFANITGAQQRSEYRYASDDTTAIQSAINTAPATIYVPKGNYGLSGSLTFPANTPCVFQGIGAGSTFDFNTHTGQTANYGSADNQNLGSSLWFLTKKLTGAAVQFTSTTQSDGSSAYAVSNIGLYGGAGKSFAGGGSDGIRITNWNNLTLDHVFVQNFAGNGIYLDTSSITGAQYAENIYLLSDYVDWNGKNGVLIGTNSGYIEGNTIQNSVLANNELAGLTTAGTVNAFSLIGSKIIDNYYGAGSGSEVNFTGTLNGLVMTGNYFEPRCNYGGATSFYNYVSSMAGNSIINGNFMSQICTAAIPATDVVFSAAGVPLPAAGIQNAHTGTACVSDATVACTAGSAYTSGGTNRCAVQSNGTNWMYTGATCY